MSNGPPGWLFSPSSELESNDNLNRGGAFRVVALAGTIGWWVPTAISEEESIQFATVY